MNPPSVPEALPPRPAEELLVRQLAESVDDRPIRQVLATSLGRAQAAIAAAERFAEARISCNFLDLYRAKAAATNHPRVAITCQSDFPDAATPPGYDLAILPCSAQGDAELTRESLQAAYMKLADGGQLWTSTDNPHDRWLRAELEKLFRRIRTRTTPSGVVYVGTRTGPLKKPKDHSCWFAFRDGERLFKAHSRPGVFSHRSIDTGARCLLETMKIEPGMRVLDIGCGAGTVGFAAAARAVNVQVEALDSNPRAVDCTRLGAEANGLTNLRVRLEADVQVEHPGEYDVVLANPPYYSHQRIATLFVEGAVRALRPQGQLLVVTKEPFWYDEFLPRWFERIEILNVRSYFVVRAARRKEPL